MSIDEKRKQAIAYKAAIESIESQKPENDVYNLFNDMGKQGRITFYPLEYKIGIYVGGNEYKITASVAQSMYDALGKMLDKE